MTNAGPGPHGPGPVSPDRPTTGPSGEREEEGMSGSWRPVPAPRMTLTEAAALLRVEPALAVQLAEDGEFPVPVTWGDAAYQLPVPQMAMLSRVLRAPQHPTPWRTAAVADRTSPPPGSCGPAQ